MDVINMDLYGENFRLGLAVDKYCEGNSLYVGMYEVQDSGDENMPWFEPFCDVTVNLPEQPLTGEHCAFIDVNDAPFLLGLLEGRGIAAPTGNYGFSGFCAYPEYRFNMDVVKQYLLEAQKVPA